MQRRALVATALFGTTGLLLLAPFAGSPAVSDPPFDQLWGALALMFFVSELAAVRLRAGEGIWTVSLNEIPLVLGLFFATPTALVLARLAGAGAAKVARRRGAAFDDLLDLSRAFAATATAVAVFRIIDRWGDTLGPVGWLAALLATAAAALVAQSGPSAPTGSADAVSRPWWQPLLPVANAMVGTSLALIGVVHLLREHEEWDDVWLVAIPIVLLWVAVRGYAGQQQRQRTQDLLFEQGVLGMGLLDAGLAITRVNDAACRITGYRRDELIGRPISELVHPDDRSETMRAMQGFVDGGGPSYTAEVRGIAKDGRVIWGNLAISPLSDDLGRIQGYLGVLQDITEAKLARERARRTEERIHEGVLALTVAREPTSVLQAVVDLARQVLGAEYGALDVLPEEGEGPSDFLVSGIDAEMLAVIGHRPSRDGLLGAVTRASEPIRLADLTRYPLSHGFPPHHPAMRSFLGVPIVYKGRALGNLYIANKIDAPEFTSEDAAMLLAFASQASVVIENARIHEREQRLIEELDRSNAELKRASEARSVFLASMSHELRAPLHAMLMAADIVRDPAFSISEERMRELSGTIAASGRHLLGLIDDLLELSRIEAGRFEMKLEPTSLNLLLMECGQATATLAANSKVRLYVPTVEDIWLEADPLRVRQALLNLLTNAVKFTDPKGRVWVEVHPSSEFATIVVCDTGSGIEPEEMARIFDPFEQGANATHGVGLGLAISRSIADAHGGRLEATSELGVGSRFELTLPRSHRSLSQPEAPRETPPAAGAAILVVEDDPEALGLTVEILGVAGYRATGARTVAEALASIGGRCPDLVVLDVKLGDEDGLDLVGRLRGEPGWRDIPVVASSASVSDADRERAKVAGCVSFLAKPLTAQALVAGVRAALETSAVR